MQESQVVPAFIISPDTSNVAAIIKELSQRDVVTSDMIKVKIEEPKVEIRVNSREPKVVRPEKDLFERLTTDEPKREIVIVEREIKVDSRAPKVENQEKEIAEPSSQTQDSYIIID